MKGVDYLSVISGIILATGGVGLLIVAFLFPLAAIYGVIALVLGIVILATLRSQERIEPIRGKRINSLGARN